MKNIRQIESFGRYFKTTPKQLDSPYWEDEIINTISQSDNYLITGNHKSYGDICLNDNHIINTLNYNKIISFDNERGILEAESGITLEDILLFLVPRGYFLYVTPGTKFITLAGAIANDIHGKNHHSYGTFGSHIVSFRIAKSTGEILTCSQDENSDLFNATIGGMGLTGVILSAKIKCLNIKSSLLETENIKFKSLDEFFSINEDSLDKFEATVAWVDFNRNCKGIYNRGNFSKNEKSGLTAHSTKKTNFPLNIKLINNLSVSIFNSLYYKKQFRSIEKVILHYDEFYYPLDKINNWNKVYGAGGFFQYQFVIPLNARKELTEIINVFKKYKQNSFLNVFKTFGNKPSPGLLSFPMEGITLAADFFYNKNLIECLDTTDEIVLSCGGRIYAAKDSRVNKDNLWKMYPNLDLFQKYIDPNIHSLFSQRVGLRGK